MNFPTFIIKDLKEYFLNFINYNNRGLLLYYKNSIYMMYFNRLLDKFPELKSELVTKFDFRNSIKSYCQFSYWYT